MGKNKKITATGTVVDNLPSTNFKVELDNGHTLDAYLSGKMRQNYIKVVQGDEVEVEMSPYDLSKGRITKRL